MAFYPAASQALDVFELVVHPRRSFSSSSSGTTGSVGLYQDASRRLKQRSLSFVDRLDEASDAQAALTLARAKRSGSSDWSGACESYLATLQRIASSSDGTVTVGVVRREPDVTLTPDSGAKHVLKNLGRANRAAAPDASWTYSNYHCLSFFTASGVSTGSALVYPSRDRDNGQYVRGELVPTGAFTLDFRVNPRSAPASGSAFDACCLFNLSGCLTVTMASGSLLDEFERVDGYDLHFALSSSACRDPRAVGRGQDLVFSTPSNALRRGRWHRVAFRWGGVGSRGTGSIDVDGERVTTFVVPSSSIAPPASIEQPYVALVGNFYDGPNSGSASQAYFFSTDASRRDGLVRLVADGGGIDEPASASLARPFCGDVHEFRYHQRWVTDAELERHAGVGLTGSLAQSASLYVPPLFGQTSPLRSSVSGRGGVLISPFQEVDATTEAPFNVALAFGVDGHEINLQNFCADRARGVWPRLFRLTSSAIATTTTLKTADEYADTPELRLANLLVSPCDDGAFVPGYELLAGDDGACGDEDGRPDASLVRLTDLVDDTALGYGAEITSGSSDSLYDDLVGLTPERPNAPLGSAARAHVSKPFQRRLPLTIYQRLRDGDSPRWTLFELNSLLYGGRVRPGTVVLRDPNVSGSSGAVSYTLRDDGRGNLYRADARTAHATWASVGHVFYDEGLVVVKSPHLWRFGRNAWSMEWEGERSVYVAKLEAVAQPYAAVSSSNPTWFSAPPSSDPSDAAESAVFVSGISWHDDKMNVVARARLAQPYLKRRASRVKFVAKIDF